jgi:folate-binding protein YgfZ
VDNSLIPNLKSHIKRYKIRKRFQLYHIAPQKLQTYAVWPAIPSNRKFSEPEALHIIDPRSPHFGSRLLNSKPPESTRYPLEVYYLRRTLLHGLPEGPEEIVPGVGLPAESNLDVMSAIDFDKGCYIGQELTSRTYHTGVIRKRLLPLSLYPSSPETEEPSTLAYNPSLSLTLPKSPAIITIEGENKRVGKFLRGFGNIGWGLCRLDCVGRPLRIEWEDGSILAKAFLPDWAEPAKATNSENV